MGSARPIATGGYPIRHRLTVDDFLALDDAGAFEGIGDVELVDGEIFVLSPVFRPHAHLHTVLIVELDLAVRTLGAPLQVLAPVSSHLDEHSLPQPDIVVVEGKRDRFVEPSQLRLVVEEFLALDEAGFFTGVGRVELIDGEIFEMAPLHRPHAFVLAELTTDLNNAVRAFGASLQVLSPVSARLDDNSLPEADIVVATRGESPMLTAADIRLMVEVSASSLSHDLRRKVALYARAGIPEYWVADVEGRRIIRFHAPEGETYRERAEFAFGEAIPAATLDGLAVDTSRIAG